MAKKLYILDEATMPNIAAAVRRKNGQSTTYLPSELPDAIDAISTTPDASSPVNTTINPGESSTVPAGYYESSSTVTASLAYTANEIASSLKSSGLSLSVRPGQSAVVGGGVFYETDSTVTAAKASLEGEVDDSIKIAETTYNPLDRDQFIDAGKYTAGLQTIVAVTADNVPVSIKEEQTVVASLTENKTVTASSGKLMTSVVVNAPDMSDADAVASDILSGKKAYVAGTLVTGTYVASGGTDTSDATATADDISLGKTAYVNGGKVTGTLEFISYSSGPDIPADTEGEDGDIFIVISDGTVETAGTVNTSTNVISLSDTLPGDTYTLKYEDANNTPLSDWAVIGTVTKI